jgi:hypothetical protein
MDLVSDRNVACIAILVLLQSIYLNGHVSAQIGNNGTLSGIINTDNFFTYSNAACGITVKYPPDWQKVELSDNYRSKSDSDVIAYLSPPKTTISENQTDFSIFSIDVKQAFSTKSLRGYTIQNLDSYKTLPKFSLMESNTTYMGDYPAYRIIFKDGSDLKSKQNEIYKEMAIWTVQNNKIYELRYGDSNQDRFDKTLPVLQAMIDTVVLETPGEYFSDDYSIRC